MTHTPETSGALVDATVQLAVESFLASTGQSHPVTQLQRDLTTTCMRAALESVASALARPADDVEIRLWDSQWVNVVNHADCYLEFDKEEAIAKAVKMTEEYMRKNYQDGKWPPPRAASPSPPVEPEPTP